MTTGADLSVKGAIQGVATHLPQILDKDNNVKPEYYHDIILFAAAVEIADAISNLNLSREKSVTPCPDNLSALADNFATLEKEDAQTILSLNNQFSFKKKLNDKQWGLVWVIWNKYKDKNKIPPQGGE